MTKIRDGKARDKKRLKRNKMKVGSRSVFRIIALQIERAEKLHKKRKAKK